ncbi:MAG: DUF6644 family protein [Vicinamibacterales bacterium]
MPDFLAWMEASALGRVMRESGPWAYAVVNLSHILGVATLFGAVLVLDLRLIGLWRRVPLSALVATSVPVAASGCALALVTGPLLLAVQATEYIGNPFLLIKFPAIALGLANALAVRRLPAWRAHATRALTRRETRQLAAAGGVSLVCWLTAITAGRMIAYW